MEEERLVKRKQKAKRDGNVNQLAEVSKDLGDIYFQSGRLNDALLEYNEQLQACEILDDKLNCAIAHRMIGEVHASLGDYEEALTHQTLHLEGAKEVDNVLEQQRALATIGRTQFCLGEALSEQSAERTEAFAAAKKAYSKSLRLCDLLEDTDIKLTEMMTMRARLLLNLGLVLEEQKEPHQAVELIEKAAELCRKHKLDEDLHRTHIALGALYERQSRFGLALKHVDMAIEVGDASLRAVGRLTKAELLLRLGHWTEAREILVQLYLSKGLQHTTSQQVERLLRIVVTISRAEEGLEVESDQESRQKLYEKLGDASVAVRSYDKAIEYYRKMLACAESEDSVEQISAALVSLVQTFRDANRFAEAVPFAQRELQLCTEPSEICRSALNLADLLYLTHSEKSAVMKIYDQALNIARNNKNRTMEALILKDMHVYLNDTCEFIEADEIKAKLDLLSDAIVDSASETESEITNIGADICLEDLSDVEAELRKKDETTATTTTTRNSRRPKRGLVVKRNEKGETKLHVACINGNIEDVEKLLAAGHPTNVKDNAGWTPLHEAANHGYVEIAELLIKAGANVNDPGGAECGGVTPLHDAATCGNFSMINLLIKQRADLELRTKDGDSVLDCLEGWRDRVDELTPSDQAEYDDIRDKLSAILPRSTKKKKKSPKNQSERSWGALVDDEDDEDDEKISAGEDYRRTIASLMNRGRIVGAATTRRHSTTPRKITAPLIDSDHTMIEDWLEDDLNCTVKEKTLVDDILPSVKRKSSNSTPDGEKTVKRPRIKSNESDEIVENINENSCDSNSSEISIIFEPRTANVSKSVKKKTRQVSLLKSGFTRDSVSRTPSPVITYTAEKSNNQFERIDEKCESELVKLMIRIEDKIVNLKLRFPEQRETTVASLMNDIIEKFEDETGCKVQITLTTMSGEILLRENTLKNVKAVDGVIRLIAEIVENEVPPITERYTKICKSHRIEPRETILKVLKACDNTSTFRLKPGEATDDEIIPLLKTLEYQQKLQILQMSGASLFSLGETLNNTLTRLSTLQELHFQGCDIDHNCLLKIDRFPPQLKVLDLSYNPLGPQSQEKIYKLISHHRYLQTLNLRFCKIEKFQCSDTWGSLVNLDLSWNPVGGEGAESFLQRQMLSLNLSNTCHPKRSSVVQEIIKGSRLSLSTLESLELSCCDVEDSDVVDILSRTPNLSKFVLSGNSKLTESALSALLKQKPTLSFIDLSGCKKIVDIPENNVYIENPRICTLIVSMSSDVKQSWLSLWRETANIHTLPHDIITFRPIVH